MDNQISLLWERLSRLVGTLTQADSLKDYKLVLASFDVNLLPRNRKKDIFSVAYCVTETPVITTPTTAPPATATSSPASCENSKAIVLDLFPSASAVNIVNNKYSDNRFGVAFVASLFSVSANAAYNHERLKMSQSLGQSAYITGFGAGTQNFGWAFGRNLGDDSVSPGNRTVYAIIAVPKTYEQISIYPTKAGWYKEGSDDWYRTSRSKFFLPTSSAGAAAPMCIELAKGLTTPACQLTGQAVNQVTYTPVEYDPTISTNSAATMQIKLTNDIDPQMTRDSRWKDNTPRPRYIWARHSECGRLRRSTGDECLFRANPLDVMDSDIIERLDGLPKSRSSRAPLSVDCSLQSSRYCQRQSISRSHTGRTDCRRR